MTITFSSRTARNGIARRAAVGTLAGLALFAGAATAPAMAAPDVPLPAFTDGEPGLASALLDAPEASDVLGDTVQQNRTVYRLGNNSAVRPSQCIGAYLAAQTDAYADTTPVDVAVRRLSGDTTLLTEGVVEMTSKKASIAHLEATADGWSDCSGLTVSETSQEDGSTNQWELGAPMVNEDRTIVTLSQTLVGGQATCERAIASYREIFIDVLACSGTGDSIGKASAVVEAIANKASAPTI